MSESPASYHRSNSTIPEDSQLTTFAPYVQAFLTQTSRRYTCCNVMLPLAFERAAGNSFVNPKFDSQVLEEQYQISIFPQIRLRFRFALLYIICMTIIWLFYFTIRGKEFGTPLNYTLGFLIMISIVAIYITFTKFYRIYMMMFSGAYALLFIVTCLSWLYYAGSSLSILGNFSICVICIICIYTVIPLRLYLCFIVASIYSILFEIITYTIKDKSYYQETSGFHDIRIYKIIMIRVMLHICVHIISFHMLLMSSVRMRGTFIKVGQNLLVRRQLELEKQLKEKMITSMMPKVVADLLLKETTNHNDYDPSMTAISQNRHHHPRTSDFNLKSMFRPFHMHSMKNVSILFADIVGFTQMSSTKTAEQLVEILNDLFERFDRLCGIYGCEKISTLGDCYYCVSGCPNAKEDHATCCVEMGLGMIDTMKIFDAERHEGIKMRVGIHTGNVLCGIVGTKRVKFDVWSNDVSFANKMESTGHPDLVHISEETKKFLDDSYIFRESEDVDGHKTYFILAKKVLVNSPSFDHGTAIKPNELQVLRNNNHNKPKNLSTNDIPSISPLSMSPSSSTHHYHTSHNQQNHQSKSLSPSPVLNHVRKHRLASISETVTRFLSSSKQHQNTSQEQQKSLLENQQRKCPTIVIGISEEASNHNNNNNNNNTEVLLIDTTNTKGTNNVVVVVEESPTTNDNLLCRNAININNNDCDNKQNINDKLVPYSNSNNCNSSNGSTYQQINPADRECSLTSPHSDNDLAAQTLTNGIEEEMDDLSLNITDLRSYISQSRCDVSPFSRTGSNRSDRTQNQQSNNYSNHHSHHHRSFSQQSNSLSPWYPPQEFSSPSRKDSGIRSNSRRSRYFTSSQSSLAPGNDSSTMDDAFMMKHLPSPATGSFQGQPGNDTLKACVQHLRKQSDLQLIKCVRDNARSQRSYLVKPPIRKFSLSFENPLMEKMFRNKAHRYECDSEMTSSTTLATPKFNTFIDVFILTIIFSTIALSLFLLSPSIYSKEYKVWVCCFVCFSSLILTVLFLCTKQVLRRPRRSRNFNSIFGWASKYYPWNFFGSILISLPVASILINFALVDINKFPTIQFYYGLMLFVCLIHFCNFIQLNCWTKNILALISGMLFIMIGYDHREVSISMNEDYQKDWVKSFSTKNVTSSNSAWFKNYEVELCLDLVLVLILVFLLNREFEIGYRLSFYGNEVANSDKIKVQHMKNQADMLLHNIIPKHVAEELKNTAKYSKNHQDVGILFASIVNFNEMYDESYLGGKEYLRVLNELIGDFDELLLRDEFKCIEKIKTIGSTYMCASGLDEMYRNDSYEHLNALLDFAVAMQNALECFNRDLLEFNLVLRIGFNFGEVTAGVIGTTKLYYDIWGDAVNVASRMDSTGVPGKIQLRQECISIFQDLYEFEPRGKVYVKGKDMMEVCLLKKKKEETLEIFQDHQLTI
ncbi:adenylate cyclase type 9 isoform X2 [Chironomus tepperi]|uniref:adenylate cyclase type 9 isoform X2 n=1 Tax=Chironomus tepperi TaxID=113505 RepID=UPI00391F8B02